MTISEPNFTQIPNILFDEWMAKLSPSAFVILMCLSRKIFGWHKTSDYISVSQIVKMTGISKNTVLKCMDELINQQLVLKNTFSNEDGHHPNEFRINVHKPIDDKYQKTERPRSDFGEGSAEIAPGVVQKLHQGGSAEIAPTKERLNTKERLTKEDSSERINPTPSKKVQIYFDTEKEEFCNITEKDYEDWSLAYPSTAIKTQIRRAAEWVKANPKKANKKNWRKFLTTWLQTSEDKCSVAEARQASYQQASNPLEDLVRQNTKHFYDLQKSNPQVFGHCYVKNGYIINKENGREARISMEKGAFESLLCDIAGVRKKND